MAEGAYAVFDQLFDDLGGAHAHLRQWILLSS
jgi:hypothetical protein